MYFCTKEYHKALEVYDQGLAIEPDNQELKDNIQKVCSPFFFYFMRDSRTVSLTTRWQTLFKVQEGQGKGGDPEQLKRAMADPEIQAILQDPVMQMVLKALSENPAASQEYDSHYTAHFVTHMCLLGTSRIRKSQRTSKSSWLLVCLAPSRANESGLWAVWPRAVVRDLAVDRSWARVDSQR